MKKARKLMAFLLAAVMVMGMTMSVSAANTTPHTIEIANATDGYTYNAYQVFAGDYSEETGKLTNIDWGAGVDGDALLKALSQETLDGGGDNPEYIAAFAGCGSAEAVAEVLANESDNSELAKSFAEVVGNYITTPAGTTSTCQDGVYTISVTGDGYYFVKNADVPTDGTHTRYLLEVVDNVEITHKGDVPEVTKEIDGGVTPSKDDAAIGDTVNYIITGTVTDEIANYNEYYYVFTDTLSKGLTYTPDSVVVTIGEVPVTEYFYVNATTDGEGVTTLKVGIQDLLALKNVADPQVTINAGTEIKITYSAVINENAVVNGDGNSNTVSLEYSNDPNNSGEGTDQPPSDDPNKPEPNPDPNEPTGETPEQKVTTYVTELTIKKIIGGVTPETALAGAAFRLEGKAGTTTNIVKATGEIFKESQTGTYYKLNDGSYTTTAPTAETESSYVGTNPYTMYEMVTETSFKTQATPAETVEAFVNEDGLLTFTGLSAGTYTITEIVTPSGYNSIDPFDVEITFADGTFTITGLQDGVIKVENNSGSTLPSTGGMGTTIFYIVGGVLVLVAVVLLVTRKRMKKEEV